VDKGEIKGMSSTNCVTSKIYRY